MAPDLQERRLACLPSFGDSVVEVAAAAAAVEAGGYDSGDSDFEFEFASAVEEPAAGAEEMFSHGRIIPAYPLFDRHLLEGKSASTAPGSPEAGEYCRWEPRSAPGSPGREAFPKSASTGEARRWRIRDLVAGRSHSDGKEKFVFLDNSPKPRPAPAKIAASAASSAAPKAHTNTNNKNQKDGKNATEMDMATAHRLYYGKGAGGGKKPSYLPYRPGIVGFFANVGALRRSHHPY